MMDRGGKRLPDKISSGETASMTKSVSQLSCLPVTLSLHQSLGYSLESCESLDGEGLCRIAVCSSCFLRASGNAGTTSVIANSGQICWFMFVELISASCRGPGDARTPDRELARSW